MGAGFLPVARQLDRLGGRVGAGAGDHRHLALRHVEAELDDALVLLVAQRRRLAGRAARHQPVRALLDLPGDEILEAALVDRAVAERRDRRDQRALEHGSPPGGKRSAATIRARLVPGNNAPWSAAAGRGPACHGTYSRMTLVFSSASPPYSALHAAD